MPKNFYVYSTMSNDNRYVKYRPGGGDVPVVESSVLIMGGANMADKRGDTVLGKMTMVTEEQMAILRQDEVFKQHEQNGYIRVLEKKYEPEKVATDLQGRDRSAPLTPNDFDEEKLDAKPRDYGFEMGKL